MKQSGVFFIALVSAVMFCIPIAAQPNSRGSETISIDTFDTTDTGWKWNAQASRYITAGFPKVGFFDGIPNSLRQVSTSDVPPKVLGIQVKFDRKGDNWFEVYPEDPNAAADAEKKNQEIPFKGIVTQLDFWVWGAGYDYILEVLLRDSEGRVFVLPVGSLKYAGWRNHVVKIPASVRQQSAFRSGPETMAFVAFRIRTKPDAFVDDFTIYFDQFKYSTSILANIYDGYELRRQDFEQEAAQ
ncbi:MAG: flagellar filament outer layer protein FlaA [Treponemataceae bacterium]|nr:MAG: flagellar filament outer layer protein FlaA [Treponemataceae bacterium]